MSSTENLPTQPQGELLLRTLAMPADTNPAGDIFGGWLMWQIDLAAGNAATAAISLATVTWGCRKKLRLSV